MPQFDRLTHADEAFSDEPDTAGAMWPNRVTCIDQCNHRRHAHGAQRCDPADATAKRRKNDAPQTHDSRVLWGVGPLEPLDGYEPVYGRGDDLRRTVGWMNPNERRTSRGNRSGPYEVFDPSACRCGEVNHGHPLVSS